MAELRLTEPCGSDFPLKMELDSNPSQADAELEVQDMDDISCNISDSDRDGGDDGKSQFSSAGGDTEALIKRLLTRVGILESQVATCLENQPLLFQVFGKCNVLEQRLKAMKKDVNGRLAELEKDPPQPRSKVNKIAPPKYATNQTETGTEFNQLNQFDSGGDREWEPDQADQDNETDPDPKSTSLTSSTSTSAPNTRSTRRHHRIAEDTEKTHGNVGTDNSATALSCKFCPMSPQLEFNNAESLANHYTSVHRLSEVLTRRLETTPTVPAAQTCPKCHKYFSTSLKLADHIKTSHNTYECKVCQAKFEFRRELRAHNLEAHAKERKPRPSTFPCPDACGLIFKTQPNAKRHLIACRGLKPHECPHCSKKYGDIRGLQDHLAADHGEGNVAERMVICSHCGRSIRKKWLRKHMEIHVPTEERQRHYCDQCSSSFLHSTDLRKHLRREHTEPDRPRLLCHFCDKTFKDPRDLRKHIVLHTDRERFICDECGRGFPQAQFLRLHKANHAKGIAKTKPFKSAVRRV